MIDWKKESITEPPLTMHFPTKQLYNSLKTGEILPFIDLPNNIQGLERMVKMVTEASSAVTGHIKRHFHIMNTLKSCSDGKIVESI